MARPRQDGQPAAAPRREKLTQLYLTRTLQAEDAVFNVWDTQQHGLVIRVQPSGHRAWKVVYRHNGRPRWFDIGDARSIGLADAREIAAEVMLKAIKGADPVSEKRAKRSAGTFAELAERYVEEHAKKKNKSWRQADHLVRRYLVPRWGRLQVGNIARSDVKALVAKIEAPIMANQILAAASAIFRWGIKEDIVLGSNPCQGVDRNEVRSRERVLSDGEIPLFWQSFDDAGLVAGSALKTILLTGQRPGEVSRMRHEHIVDGWWEMPGKPDPKVGWPGTKNGESHRVWLSESARAVLAEVSDGPMGFVFAGARGRAIGKLDGAMRRISAKLGVEPVTPHDLRRTFSTKVTGLGFGREALNRVTSHKEGGIASVYDRHQYAGENKRIMEAVAAHIVGLAEGRADGNVVAFNRP